MKAYIVYFEDHEDIIDKIFIDKKEAKKYATKSGGEIIERNICEKCDEYISLHVGRHDAMRETKLWGVNYTNVYTDMSSVKTEEGIECEKIKEGMFFTIDLVFPSEEWTRATVEAKGKEIAIKVRDFAKKCLDEQKTIKEINGEFKAWDLEELKK